MTDDDLIAYYKNLLIAQYALKENALATIDAYVAQVIAEQIVASVRAGFNLPSTPGAQADTAIGAQLDAIASYRGVTRFIFGLDITRLYFTMPDYGDSDADTVPGFGIYGEPVTWYFLTYSDENRPIYEMNDSEMTRLIQFRAQTQGQDLTVGEIDDIMFDFFGYNAAVFESALMTLTYLFLEDDPDSLSFILTATESLPRPAGVQLLVIHASSTSGLFGFQQYNQSLNNTFVGFSLYGADQPAAFLEYE